MILGLQIIALVFALVMIYIAYVHYRKGEINGLEILFWLICWMGAIGIIIFPEVFKVFSATIAISRAFDLAVLGGFILIIPLVYLSHVKTNKLEKKFEDFIRTESLQNIRKKKKNQASKNS